MHDDDDYMARLRRQALDTIGRNAVALGLGPANDMGAGDAVTGGAETAAAPFQVALNPAQKAVVDRMLGQMGSDPLADRARAAYGRALGGGRIRVR
jgi:hypothetical protein